ncbi:MAG: hypothetical protein HPY75_02120 [Actinobacteria bacterium]|nr:hypothetical protein [Actinomycetota bacterium]
MGLFERMDVWARLGRLMNSPFGVRFLSALRGLVEKAARPVAAGKSDERPAFTPFAKDLREARVSLVTTTGIHLDDQEPFDTAAALGDSTFRAIPRDVDVSCLRIAHTHYPHERALRDINVIFPVERLRELEREGAIGSVGAYHYSFGFDLHVKELVDPDHGTAHELARRLRDDRVDVVLFTPG